MNARERFVAQMHYQPVDRCPIMDFGFWDETLVIWREQGYPEGADSNVYFDMDRWDGIWINTGLHPGFEWKVLEDRGDTELVRDGAGVTKIRGKFLGSIPQEIAHTLKDRKSWEKEFKWRLDGSAEGRYPADWVQREAQYKDPDRPNPIGLPVGSLYGCIRDWMGVENVSYLVHDDPDLFGEMVETVADCIIQSITPALESGIRCEYASFWEDMCYRGGPLLSPRHFRKFLVPNYTRITRLIMKYGIDVVTVDCDGDISQLVPLWLEAGVNTMFPIEVGVWGADPVAYRKQYGKDLLMIGGVGKRILAAGPEAITAEVERLLPLVEEGGYIPLPDHRVPPDVTLANYQHYLAEARRVWGRPFRG